jgi:hypothetical protein
MWLERDVVVLVAGLSGVVGKVPYVFDRRDASATASWLLLERWTIFPHNLKRRVLDCLSRDALA